MLPTAVNPLTLTAGGTVQQQEIIATSICSNNRKKATVKQAEKLLSFLSVQQKYFFLHNKH